MCLFIEVENSNKSQRKEDEFFFWKKGFCRGFGGMFMYISVKHRKMYTSYRVFYVQISIILKCES